MLMELGHMMKLSVDDVFHEVYEKIFFYATFVSSFEALQKF
jgi:hypothetical protein